ncbi:ankyrin repeat domain-containing protein [Paenibacillus sp. AR247]|uniref:ankyrin repeat domain-containing protein n=1 Tax=Paenibacillus sp. AR247 TaxID=1631599 RepID=UPI0021571EEF|nr:ankyrin repeat domain-containing protein [Paenibacillus sp. AR247]
MEWTEASKSKELETVRAAVDQLDPNERDARGRTPLMLFITNRMPVDGIKLLLEKNVDLEAEDKLGDTALKKAVKFKQPETVKLLIANGAQLNSPHGILGTAWQAARMDKAMADLLAPRVVLAGAASCRGGWLQLGRWARSDDRCPGKSGVRRDHNAGYV